MLICFKESRVEIKAISKVIFVLEELELSLDIEGTNDEDKEASDTIVSEK